ncbi:hypothetical protein C8Q76DRAFT_361477 [Earliella scabrosa]|nr:hypothetical protein C8Q76DRAFT_361477 [Earliella scabrosa]
MTTATTRSWDIAATSASTTPTLSKRRGQQYRSQSGHTRPPSQSHEGSDTPFPRKSTSSDSLRGEDEVPAPTQRTVRRKKSSLDLRDIFLNGGVFPPQPQSSESSPSS